MASRSERFRAKSLECALAAQRARDEAAKTSFLEIAERWRELADRAESMERERVRESRFKADARNHRPELLFGICHYLAFAMADKTNDAAAPAPPANSAPASGEQADDIVQLRTLMHSLRRTKVTLLRAIDAYQESMTLLRDLEARDDG